MYVYKIKSKIEHTYMYTFRYTFSERYTKHTPGILLCCSPRTNLEYREVYDAAEKALYITW